MLLLKFGYFCTIMIANELVYQIRQVFAAGGNGGLLPTVEQEYAIGVFAQFMTDRRERVVMVLRGSAGTGKTTLASAMVQTMVSLRQKLMLLAPTGRAAKVFAMHAGLPAYTIHRRIYRQRSAGDLSAFNLNANLHRDMLFVVDEASMISNQGMGDSTFGSGCLLDDLMQFVYSTDANCRLLLIGDAAQLPPVGEAESPALLTGVLRGYGLTVYEAALTEVLRQAQQSGILWNATMIRQLITRDEATALPRISLEGFADVQVVNGDELIEQLATSYSRVGLDETIVITRSNKRANIYNRGIRATVLDREDELCRGDRLMIVKNNYYWCEAARGTRDGERKEGGLTFLANGDQAVVQRVRGDQSLYGFSFATVTLQLPDYDNEEMEVTALLDTLTAEAPALTREQQQQLFEAVMADYQDVPLKADRLRQLKHDRYYNALQVKFAYAVTCHKAQGGQWAHVYLDQGYMTDDMLTPDYIHWLYTAFTRATEHLYLVNRPITQCAAGE